MQFNLFSASGQGLLFGRSMLKQYLDENRDIQIPDELSRLAVLRDWVRSVPKVTFTETSLEQKFSQEVLGKVLGYSLWPPVRDAFATAWPKPPTSATGIRGAPDLVLGFFNTSNHFSAVVELKPPGTDLDAPQARQDPITPIEQAFNYGQKILGVRWVLVTDMMRLRLYSVESPIEYEEFDFSDSSPEKFRRLFFLLHHDYLVSGGTQAPVSRLHRKSASRQIEIRDGFYKAYFDIRSDVFRAISDAAGRLVPPPSRNELLGATQRLLDRLLFIFYCEDHPQLLVPPDLVKNVTESARRLPGTSNTRVYDALKALFREVDSGSPVTSGVQVSGYNGELFKPDRIIDHVSLPDSLHDKVYTADEPDGSLRRIQGAWGLYVYDFWSELNEHLLGHIFQESLSDLIELGFGRPVSVAEKLKERKRNGIFYTDNIISDFLSSAAIQELVSEEMADQSGVPTAESLQLKLDRLSSLRIVDFACGSGAFLVSSYRELLRESWRIIELTNVLGSQANAGQLQLRPADARFTQALLLRNCLYGVDLLAQAVEIAKLALWLRSARKGERVADLGSNLTAADSLNITALFERLGVSAGSFDVVVGNPPWGGEIKPDTYLNAVNYLNLDGEVKWDSWELFLILAIAALREGGRLALVLPDSLLYPEKARTRKILLENTRVEKIYSLGPDWFGKAVRMGTVLVQARKGKPPEGADIRGLLLVGKQREKAIRGEIPLSQLEAQLSRDLPYERSLISKDYEIEVFRGRRDDEIIAGMDSRSHVLSVLCERFRGEEMSKDGLVWICSSCLTPNTPGKKRKGGGYLDKNCSNCGYRLTEDSVRVESLVSDNTLPGIRSTPFIDGDDIAHRYRRVVPHRWLRLDLSGLALKAESLYQGTKLLIRQAGVGLMATYDESGARCPQSVYIYRLVTNGPEVVRYRHEFVLAALLSRAMAYYIFKRFSEVDPAKAHAKLTHDRLANLPIPRIDFESTEQRKAHDEVCSLVVHLLDGGATLGGAEDRRIETVLRGLWGISNDDGAYINGEFADLPPSQVLQDLFPAGPPERYARLGPTHDKSF